jgi:hypothetical protein
MAYCELKILPNFDMQTDKFNYHAYLFKMMFLLQELDRSCWNSGLARDLHPPELQYIPGLCLIIVSADEQRLPKRHRIS